MYEAIPCAKKRAPVSIAACLAGDDSQNEFFMERHGSYHAGGWKSVLLASWHPYIQLSRLDPPISWLLVFLPELFGVFHVATSLNSLMEDVLRALIVLLAHSFFLSNAGVAWNDLVDAHIDARVERTKNRPIARGSISRKAAFMFVCSQTVLAAACLLLLPYATVAAIIPAGMAMFYYPYAKRHMPVPQLVIGFCMGWAVMVGRLALGFDRPWLDKSTNYLMGATSLWTVLCDAVYAHQDLADDSKIGVGSLAVVVKGYARIFLRVLLLGMVTLLYYSGLEGGIGLAYNFISFAGSSIFASVMLTLVDLDDPASCGRWAGTSFGLIGLLIASGLLVSYLVS